MKMLLHRCWAVWLRRRLRWQEKLRMLSTEAIASPDSFFSLFCAALAGLELMKTRLPLNSQGCGCLCLQNGGINGVPLQAFPRLAASVVHDSWLESEHHLAPLKPQQYTAKFTKTLNCIEN